MKIDVSKITDEPISLTETIPAQNWDLASLDIEPVGDILLSAEFSRIDKEILVSGQVSLNTKIICDRCQEPGQMPIDHEFSLSYSVSEIKDVLDIDQSVREDILLDYPMKVLCSPDCKGLCPDCGVDLNTERCKCCKKPNRR